MITDKNIFERGMLIHLKMGGYDGRMKLSDEQLKDLPKEIVRGVHDIFDANFKDMLKEIGSFDQETRWCVKRKSIPFAIDGVYFINSKTIPEIIEVLDKRKEERKALIDKAVDNYDMAIVNFQNMYPEYFEHAKRKYLSKKDFAGRFYYTYQFIKIAAPDKESSFISPEMYKDEMTKFKSMVDEMKQEVLSTIYQTLIETTKRLKKQCTDGKPNQRTLNTLNTFLKQIDDVYSDFIDRDDMKKTIDKIKVQVMGIDAKDLRTSEELKKSFVKEITNIGNEIKAISDIPLKRAIEF